MSHGDTLSMVHLNRHFKHGSPFVLGVDTNARPKFKVVINDKLIAKLCHMVIHYQWFTSTGILSMVLLCIRG